ncbi:DUF6864 domain-containing function [Photobacterium leiognathi]|uniref:DUF6864 domain-containing function n=1 Tax=Photobacterium leiognathi TaxID=553611 RepID=UPI00298225BF|nr:hypothetical protein [Photobacterium leiognathi]
MEIKTGNLTVFKSGIVRTGFTNNVKFDFNTIWVDMVFLRDNDNKEFRSEFLGSDDNIGLTINLYNSDSTLGSGIVKPIKIGNLEGNELWLAYRTFRAFEKANDVWVIEYVFYKGDIVNE